MIYSTGKFDALIQEQLKSLEDRVEVLEQVVAKQSNETDEYEEDWLEDSKLWRGLAFRPPEGVAGWETKEISSVVGSFEVRQWRDPKTGVVEWIDKSPQLPVSMDWYFITSGVRDVNAPIWNGLWSPAEFINNRLGIEGEQRLLRYTGGLRGTPSIWPERERNLWKLRQSLFGLDRSK